MSRTVPARPSVRILAGVTTLCALALTGVIATTSQASAAAHPLHTVTTGGVSLDVPASWHVSTAKGAGTGCIVATGLTAPTKDKAYGVDDCQLRVLTGSQIGTRFRSVDTFYVAGTGDPAQCIRGGQDRSWVTAAATATRVGPAQAEYRRFTRACVSRPAEQWFVSGAPSIFIERTSANPGTEKAARAAVGAARLPAAGIGYARSYTGVPESASGTSVTLEPARLSYDDTGTATASYVLDRSLRVDISHAAIRYVDADGNQSTLTPAQLVRLSATAFPRIGAANVPALIVGSNSGSRVESVIVIAAHRPR